MHDNRQTVVEDTRRRLGPIGTWIGELLRGPVADDPDTAARIEELGYTSLFVGEVIGGKEVFASAAIMLAATSTIVCGTGIANVWSRHPATMTGAAATLGARWPGRLINGVGVSHSVIVDPSGSAYEKPMAHMKHYLDGMDAAESVSPDTSIAVPRILAALGPRMLELARDRSDGAHPYLVPAEHTSFARDILGPDKLLIPEQKVVLCTDPTEARRIARSFIGPVIAMANYANNLRRFDYTDDDLSDGGSDRLVDALVAWGDEEQIARRIHEFNDRGADHVLVHPLATDLAGTITQLERLAPALLGR